VPRYWVIAPYHAEDPEVWERVWEFDLRNGLISIGWPELDEVSRLGDAELRAAIERAYPEARAGVKTQWVNMIWAFYHTIQPGDVVIARRGTKKVAGVGTVKGPAYYEHVKNIEASGAGKAYSNHIDVAWHETPRDKEFPRVVFGMQTLYEIKQVLFDQLIGPPPLGGDLDGEGVENRTEFILEKYLEDFIVTNFDAIFGGRLVLYKDSADHRIAQQYVTEVGTIDILACEPSGGSFVVIELKKGRESDTVVGQTLRYMGWVCDKLCQEGQSVKGMIICREPDPRLLYALKMTSNISIQYYRVDFRLSDAPQA
jgi:restriction system protein